MGKGNKRGHIAASILSKSSLESNNGVEMTLVDNRLRALPAAECRQNHPLNARRGDAVEPAHRRLLFWNRQFLACD
jgi:hypothetical protein